MTLPRSSLNWEQLRYFISTAAAGSLRVSSEQLGVSTATLSRHITALEQSLSLLLFHRKTTGLDLTSDGHLLLEHCKKMQSVASDIMHLTVDNQQAQEIRLASIPCLAHFLLLPALPDFQQRWPTLKLVLNTSPELSELNEFNIDIAIRLSRPQSGRFLVRRISQFNLAAYQKVDQALHLDPAPPLILWGSFHGYSSRVNDLLTQRYRQHREVLLSNNLFDIIQAIQSGVGIGYLPDYVAAQIEGIERVADIDDLAQQDVWMVIREDAQRRASVREFADYICELVPNPMCSRLPPCTLAS